MVLFCWVLLCTNWIEGKTDEQKKSFLSQSELELGLFLISSRLRLALLQRLNLNQVSVVSVKQNVVEVLYTHQPYSAIVKHL
jgi:hypothetical protein